MCDVLDKALQAPPPAPHPMSPVQICVHQTTFCSTHLASLRRGGCGPNTPPICSSLTGLLLVLLGVLAIWAGVLSPHPGLEAP